MNNRNEYIKRYTDDHYKRYSLNLNIDKDRDIIQAIEETDPDNIQGAIKRLIRRGLTSTLL